MKELQRRLSVYYSKHRRAFWIIIIFLLPVLITWPTLGNRPYPLSKPIDVKLESVTPGVMEATSTPRYLTSRVETTRISSFLAGLVGSRIRPMPTELCLKNENKIMDGHTEIDPDKLIDRDSAGAMSFRLYVDPSTPLEIYVQRGKKECRTIPNEGVSLDLAIQMKNPLPIDVRISQQPDGNIKLVIEDKQRGVRIGNDLGFQRIKWDLYTFFRNLAVAFFGWWVLLSSMIALYQFVSKPCETDDKSN